MLDPYGLDGDWNLADHLAELQSEAEQRAKAVIGKWVKRKSMPTVGVPFS